MAGQLQPLTQKDFSGGLNLSTNPYNIPKKQLWRVRNLILDEHGSVRTRPGSAVLSDTTGITKPITYVKYLKTAAGVTHKFAIVQDTLNKLYDIDNDPYTLVSTFTTNYRTPQAVTVYDKAVIAAGYEVPKIYDGTTVTDLTAQAGQTVPPGAKHIAYHLGSLWVWNTNDTTTTLDGPSSLRMAAVGKIDDWPNANQTFIAKDDGQVGMGMATFTIVETGISPISTLVLFKDFSAYQLTGVFGSSNFAVQQIKSDMGCIAPRSIQFVSGFGIIRLTHKGFALFDGVDDKLISEDIRPMIFGNAQDEGDIASIDFSTIETACAGQVQNPPLYICAVPVENSYLTRYFVLDLIRKSWTICDFPYDISWIGTAFENSEGNLIAGDATDGTIYRLMGVDDTHDDGVDIDWSMRTGPVTGGDPTGQVFWRRLLLDLVYDPYQEIDYDITVNGYTGSLTGSRVPPLLVTAGRTDIGIMRTAPSVYAELSGSGNIRLRGLTWQARSKPLTRAVL